VLCRALAAALSRLPAAAGGSDGLGQPAQDASAGGPPPAPHQLPHPAAAPANAGARDDACARALAAAHALLESEATPPALLAPLLRLLAAAARAAPAALLPLWEDLLDILLGWALEPSLADEDRRGPRGRGGEARVTRERWARGARPLGGA
jgi:hypothetical protein